MSSPLSHTQSPISTTTTPEYPPASLSEENTVISAMLSSSAQPTPPNIPKIPARPQLKTKSTSPIDVSEATAGQIKPVVRNSTTLENIISTYAESQNENDRNEDQEWSEEANSAWETSLEPKKNPVDTAFVGSSTENTPKPAPVVPSRPKKTTSKAPNEPSPVPQEMGGTDSLMDQLEPPTGGENDEKPVPTIPARPKRPSTKLAQSLTENVDVAPERDEPDGEKAGESQTPVPVIPPRPRAEGKRNSEEPQSSESERKEAGQSAIENVQNAETGTFSALEEVDTGISDSFGGIKNSQEKELEASLPETQPAASLNEAEDAISHSEEAVESSNGTEKESLQDPVGSEDATKESQPERNHGTKGASSIMAPEQEYVDVDEDSIDVGAEPMKEIEQERQQKESEPVWETEKDEAKPVEESTEKEVEGLRKTDVSSCEDDKGASVSDASSPDSNLDEPRAPETSSTDAENPDENKGTSLSQEKEHPQQDKDTSVSLVSSPDTVSESSTSTPPVAPKPEVAKPTVPARPVKKTFTSEDTKSKMPPPKPKKLSSRMAAFQEMFEKVPLAGSGFQPPVKSSPAPTAKKLSPDKIKFADNLKTLVGKGVALPGMVAPELSNKANSEVEPADTTDESKPKVLASSRRAKGPRSRLPKALKEPTLVEASSRFQLVQGKLWSLEFSKGSKDDSARDEEATRDDGGEKDAAETEAAEKDAAETLTVNDADNDARGLDQAQTSTNGEDTVKLEESINSVESIETGDLKSKESAAKAQTETVESSASPEESTTGDANQPSLSHVETSGVQSTADDTEQVDFSLEPVEATKSLDQEDEGVDVLAKDRHDNVVKGKVNRDEIEGGGDLRGGAAGENRNEEPGAAAPSATSAPSAATSAPSAATSAPSAVDELHGEMLSSDASERPESEKDWDVLSNEEINDVDVYGNR